MRDPNHNPVVWIVAGYIVVAFGSMLVGKIKGIVAAQFIGASMLMALLCLMFIVIAMLIYERRTARRKRAKQPISPREYR